MYIDNRRIALGRICHMTTDTVAELRAMADRIGLARHWFQDRRVSHYDINQKRRAVAVKAGAIEIDRRQTVSLIRKHGWSRRDWMKTQGGSV